MAVQLITGSSGAGKSHYIYHKIIEESMATPHHDYLILVPEQFTMQTQKELVHMHPMGGILNIDVLSFNRLAYRVFEEVGGDSRPLLEETGKTLVLQKVVQDHHKELKYLASQMGKPGYIQEMKSLISELMQYDIQNEKMEEMLAKSMDKALLYEKMKDVKVLYREFRSYLEERFLTGEEVLDVLCSKLPLSGKLSGSTIVLDGFTGFTPIQYRVLKQLMSLCPMIYITVTYDGSDGGGSSYKPYELFAMSKQMMRKVQEKALEAGTKILKPVHIMEGEHSRFSKNPALHHLEQSLFRYGRKPFEQKTKAVEFFAASNPLEEMRKVSREIAALVRDEGYRYGEIAVITGDLETYGNYAAQVFGTADIPYFLDRKHSVLMNPFVEYIRSALDVMVQNFSYESVFRHLRCGLTNLTWEEIDLLENYVVALGVRGRKQWQETWVRVYRGMKEEEILEVNKIRKKAMEGLDLFAEQFKKRGNTVAEAVKALYEYIVGGRIQEKLEMQRIQFAGCKETAMEKEYEQIYGIVMSLLDKLVEILGQERITQREFVQLMEAGLSEASVGIIPPSTDQVLVGDIERTRLKDIKALYFVGVNDGIIPKNRGGGGILSDPDREFFAGEGISLAPTPREAMYMQRFYLYLNMTKPSGKLTLSYSLSNAGGEAMGPAYLMGVMSQMFPQIAVQEVLSEEEDYQRPQDSLSDLAAGMRTMVQSAPSDAWKELYSWYVRQPEYQVFLEKLQQAAFYRKPEDKISASVAKVLYGEVSVHSATRLERYSACAFAHFLQYGLRLKERIEYEFTSMDMGNVMHNALEYFSEALKREGLEWKELTDKKRNSLVEESLKKVTDDYGNTILHSSARNKYMIRRVKRLLKRTVWALQSQLQHGEFRPEDFEISIGGGRIDRLDVYEEKDRVCVRVIDYKTGNTSFDLLAVYHGLQMQLMVYLDGALMIERKKYPDREVVPAGVFYYNIQDPMIQESIEADVKDLEKKLLKDLKMNGLAIADKEILEKMDTTYESLPVSLNKDGSFSRYSKVAGAGQMEQLSKYVNRKIQEICRMIREGEASIAPYELGNKNGCTYCPYRSICGFDEKIPGYSFRRLKQFTDEQIWQAVQEGEEVQ